MDAVRTMLDVVTRTPDWKALHVLIGLVPSSAQPDYVVALAGAPGFAVMIGNADGPAFNATVISSCHGANVTLAADFNGDGHMGASHNC